jgi:hypothetical protein
MINKKPTNIEEEKVTPSMEAHYHNMGFMPYNFGKNSTQPSLTNNYLSNNNVIIANTDSVDSDSKHKISRKRRRISIERDLSPETFRKTRNKRLAKESRNRKTVYIKSLEAKISNLESKIISLNEKVESYRKKISHLEINDGRGHENLSSAQEYWHNDMAKILKDKSKNKNLSMDKIVNYFVSTLGVIGSDRTKVIKNAVKVIIDNIVPESCKVLLFINRYKLTATDKQLETLKTSSKYKYEELMVENKFGIVEEVFTKVNITKQQRKFLKQQ